jgi:hypothetical protein
MQTNVPAQIPGWLSWAFNSGVALGGAALFVRLVVHPTLQALFRRDLKPELDALAANTIAVRDLVTRTEANERGLQALSDVPVTLVRIEADLKYVVSNMERRSTPRGD